jgi:octanoyl-[GcvH]:protein N-octanoyltransferase
VSIDAFEVSDSYCPGEFDLSIDGKKFAGISQRRIKKGIGIMIYLSVNGNQQARGELVRDFYQASLGEDFGQKNFPPVNPDSMANLSDLLKADLTVANMVTRLKKVIETDYIISDEKQQTFNDFLESEDFKDSYTFQEKRMLQRNEIINWEALDK